MSSQVSDEVNDRASDARLYTLRARGADLAPLADLWIASWQAVMPAIDFSARRSWFFAHVEEVEGRGGEIWCACDAAHRVTGFILIDVAQGVLEQLAVAPAQFGSGLGGALLDHAKKLSPAGLRLSVNKDNPRAVRFYEKHGFARCGAGVNPLSGLLIWQLRWAPDGTSRA